MEMFGENILLAYKKEMFRLIGNLDSNIHLAIPILSLKTLHALQKVEIPNHE